MGVHLAPCCTQLLLLFRSPWLLRRPPHKLPCTHSLSFSCGCAVRLFAPLLAAAFTQITFRTTLQVGVGASAAVVRVPPPKKAAAPAPKATTTSPSGTGSTTGTGGGTGTGSTTGGGVSGGGTTAAGATAQSGPPSAVSPPPGISGGAPTEEFDPFWG